MASADPLPDRLLGARRLRELLDAHDIRPTKAFGQNFVIDPNTIRKVVQASGLDPDDAVLEIGAGLGSLTLGLAAAARRVVAVELDRRLVPLLTEVVSSRGNVEVIEADALTLPFGDLAVSKLVANLPYNIAVPLVIRVLEEAPQIRSLVVMTQREVGERLVASPGSKSYGQVSVLVRYFGTGTLVGKISRQAFFPVPNVDSVLVRIDRAAQTPPIEPQVLFPMVKAAFAQRRKTLRNALAAAGYPDVEGAAASAGLDPASRAEELSLDDFVSLAQKLGALAP